MLFGSAVIAPHTCNSSFSYVTPCLLWTCVHPTPSLRAPSMIRSLPALTPARRMLDTMSLHKLGVPHSILRHHHRLPATHAGCSRILAIASAAPFCTLVIWTF